jgi:SCY1-like protein 1
MAYLRSFGSAALSTMVQKLGPSRSVPRFYSSETFWSLYDATKRASPQLSPRVQVMSRLICKEDGSFVLVFEYDITHPFNKSTIPLARNSLRNLRTVRHPDVLRFIDVVESDSTMTERICPLPLALSQSSSDVARERED